MMNLSIECPSGYHLDAEKRCQLDCDICEDVNAEFKDCGNRCKEFTCDIPFLKVDIACPTNECDIGCFCKDGYVRDPKTKLCIRPKLCPSEY